MVLQWEAGEAPKQGAVSQEQPREHVKVEEFLAQLGKEYEQAQKELQELGVLVAQTSAEIEKLVHRNTQIAGKMRQVETNFETAPREDIKNTYTAYHEAQMRLFMMRSQLEQLQNKQASLEKFVLLAQSILSLSGDLARVAPGQASQPSTDQSQKEVIIQIIQAQENERQILARQMHDGPAQSLSNLILQAEVCERLFDRDPAQARNELKSLKNAVSAAFQKTRAFIFDLRPMMLDDLGLAPTLQRYIEDLQKKEEFLITLNIFGSANRFAPHTEVVVFRAVQALLNNVRRHAQASQAQVTLDIQGDQISVKVEDDGTGFNVEEALQAARQRKALGLSNIMEQVRMMGGTFEIDSQIGKGTKVQFTIPTT